MPVTLAPGIPVKPAPDPINLPVVVTLPLTLTNNKLPTVCKVEFSTLALSVDPTKALASTFDAAMPVSNEPLPIK